MSLFADDEAAMSVIECYCGMKKGVSRIFFENFKFVVNRQLQLRNAMRVSLVLYSKFVASRQLHLWKEEKVSVLCLQRMKRFMCGTNIRDICDTTKV